MQKISIIIPAYNEEKSIASVIKTIRNSTVESQIIVVNNCSTDNTVEEAKKGGADKVAHCDKKGKGYAMEEGLKHASNDIIVFIDGDLKIETNQILELMTNPILLENVDFVKSTFDREGGRVTELVTKPLLDLLFPDMYKFGQPLSGIIAGKKEVFENITFEKDYAVDIGILLDVIQKGYKVKEVFVGKIENCSQSWHALSEMSKEVMRGILKRANVKIK